MITCEVPKRMRTRPRDHRGYPVPYVVLTDATGRPHFTVNNVWRVVECARKRLCGMCGKRLERAEGFWFIGGPGSTLHPAGRYIDGPSHEACARYAMQVCPYLAMPRYAKRIDDRTINPAHLAATLITFNPSVDDQRPDVFCLARATDYGLIPGDGEQPYFDPVRPWVTVEYWRHGTRLPDEEGAALATAKLRRLLADGDRGRA